MEFIRKANQSTTIVFPLLVVSTGDYDDSDLINLVPGDVMYAIHLSTGWQAFAAPDNMPVALGGGYFAMDVVATELNPDNRRYPTIIKIVDQSSSKVWKDDSMIIRFDSVAHSRARVAGAFTSTAGVAFRCLVWAEEDGNVISLSTSATASIAVYEQSSGGVALFTLASGGTAPDANGIFSLEQSLPGFTADRIYYGIVTITDGNHTYKGIEPFPCFG